MSSIAKSKVELMQSIEQIYSKLIKDYQRFPQQHARDVGVEGNIKGTLISVADTLAYLIGWGQLVLKWQDRSARGLDIDFPETGYNWNQLGELATHFHQLYADNSYAQLQALFAETTESILTMIGELTDEQLYGPVWYKTYTLGRMIQFNTSSPMKNMRTKVRRYARELADV